MVVEPPSSGTALQPTMLHDPHATSPEPESFTDKTASCLGFMHLSREVQEHWTHTRGTESSYAGVSFLVLELRSGPSRKKNEWMTRALSAD